MKEREHVREKVSGRHGNGEGTHTDAEAADGETGGCDGGEKQRLIADEEVRAVQMKQNHVKPARLKHGVSRDEDDGQVLSNPPGGGNST